MPCGWEGNRLASHWPRITDISGSPPTDSRPGRGRWAPAYALLRSMVNFTFYLLPLYCEAKHRDLIHHTKLSMCKQIISKTQCSTSKTLGNWPSFWHPSSVALLTAEAAHQQVNKQEKSTLIWWCVTTKCQNRLVCMHSTHFLSLSLSLSLSVLTAIFQVDVG